jgi:pantetheine-phosphate adenylyltransferase
VVIDTYAGLLTDYAKQIGATMVIKGLRNATDFEYEGQMDYFNKRLAPELETVYLISDNRYSVLSSSAIRELMTFGGNLDGLVPEPVLEAVRQRQEGQNHNG